MDVLTGYDSPYVIANETTLPATITVTEATIWSTTNLKPLRFSQLTVYSSTTLNSNNVTYNYYYSPDNGTTWYPVSLYNTSTGEMTQRAVLVDAGTYATGGVSYFVDNVPLGAATQLKITAKTSASTVSTYVITVMARNN